MSSDDQLLARLNALKQSSINLNHSSHDGHDLQLDEDVFNSGAARSLGDEMSRRLRALQQGSDSARSDGGGRREAPTDVEDDKTFEDLMSELAQNDTWRIAKDEEAEIDVLINSAKSAVETAQGEQRLVPQTNDRDAQSATAVNAKLPTDREAHVSKENEDELDNEADEYLAQVLAELESTPSSIANALPEAQHGYTDKPQPRKVENEADHPPSYAELAYDDQLASRFANLGLPSVPTTIGTSVKAKTPATPKGYTDEDIGSWCIICNEDATLSCKGCDDDLYCTNCWLEGHKGPDAGHEEREHKAVEYNRRSKAKRLMGL